MVRPLRSADEVRSNGRSITEAIDRITAVNPQVQRVALFARDLYAYARISARVARHNLGSDAPIDPFARYHVDPTRIDHAMRPFNTSKWALAGRVLGGDWDRDTSPFTDLDGLVHFDVYESFEAHFHEGVPWEETAFYERLLGEIRRGRIWWGCTSTADVDERCAMIDRLYERIAVQGYRSQGTLGEDSIFESTDRLRPTRVNKIVEGEIAVNIGRDGELIFYDGRNRLAIAKLQEIERIPVVILVRHRKWQRFRERVALGEQTALDLPNRLHDHPDLQSIS